MRTIVSGLAIVLLGAAPGSAQVQFEQIQLISHPGQDPVAISIIRADPRQVAVRVIASIPTSARARYQYVDYSLREMFDVERPSAIINGGFSGSFVFPIPVGLVVSDGRQYGALNQDSGLQTGIFCVNGGKAQIIHRSNYLADGCAQALQSGPIVVEPGSRNGIRINERTRPKYTRSIVCVDTNGQVLLIRSSSAHLYDLGEMLRRPVRKDGLGCETALNLSGYVESGMIIAAKSSEREIGAVRAAIASAIAIGIRRSLPPNDPTNER